MFINNLIGLVSSYLYLPWLKYWFFPFLALTFISIVPFIVRSFFRR